MCTVHVETIVYAWRHLSQFKLDLFVGRTQQQQQQQQQYHTSQRRRKQAAAFIPPSSA